MSNEVKPGDVVTADRWNRLDRDADASNVLLGGENMRVSKFPHGTLLNAKHGGGWTHPWRVIAAQLVALIAPGTVNGEYPSIRDRDGNVARIDATPQPMLDMASPKVGPNNIGWIALELQLEEDYRKIKTAFVVQCDFIVKSELGTTNPFFFFGLPGIGNFKVRYPLARLHWSVETGLDIFQVAMFNLNHTCKPPAQQGAPGENAQSTLPRHFFYPA